ncbi:hypothetical protein LZC95_49965 [Pendulispora brunnea]|uniref:Nucleotidyltransferase domain-containing protein n=1 Tax=Pendulispora brunnea TaxID=2905690 RepID=A0ABZ2K772_9BACT
MATERRFPRERFRRVLERILGRLDAEQTYRATWRDDFFRDERSSTFRVKALYVAGSWARGAPDCGDLDLLLSIDAGPPHGHDIPKSQISRLVTGSPAYVQVHTGTPEDNSSHVEFPEAQLLWSVDDRDWQSKLDAIKVDPNAGRFSRKYDALPMRPGQLRTTFEVLDEVVEQLDRGIIASEWVPIGAIQPKPDTWDEETEKWHRWLSIEGGKQARKVGDFVLQYLFATCPSEIDLGYSSNPLDFRYGGFYVTMGRPYLDIDVLNNVNATAVVLAPYITTRGPNGIWILRRGAQHPFQALFERVRCCVASECGKITFTKTGSGFRNWQEANLFTSEKKLRRYMKDFRYRPEDYEVVWLEGLAIIEAVGHAGALLIDDKERIPLSRYAKDDDDDEPVIEGMTAVASIFRRRLST